MKEIYLNTKPPCDEFETYEDLLEMLYADSNTAYACLIKTCKQLMISLKHEYYYLPQWEIEELIWDALTELINKLKNYGVKKGNLKAFLRLITYRDIIDLIRKKIYKYNLDGRLMKSKTKKSEDSDDEQEDVESNNPELDKRDYYLPKTKYIEVDEGFEKYYLDSDIYNVEALSVYSEFEKQLSDDEKKILKAIYPSHSERPLKDDEIADDLNKSEKTIKNIKSELKKKLINFFGLKNQQNDED